MWHTNARGGTRSGWDSDSESLPHSSEIRVCFFSMSPSTDSIPKASGGSVISCATGAYMALLGMFGLGLGLIIRNTAGAISAFVGLTFLLPVVLQPLTPHGNPARFAPEQILANSVATVVPQSGQLSPATGFLWMVFYCASVLVVGTMFLVQRDA